MKLRIIRHIAKAYFKRWFDKLVERHLLFPAITIFLLCIIWAATAFVIRVDRNAAERAAIFSSHELLESYKAQVLRSLHEIDQTLKFVKYSYELEHDAGVLSELKDKDLLPPDMHFVITIADEAGNTLASSHPHNRRNIYDQHQFSVLQKEDRLFVSRPRRIGSDWKLIFSRRLNSADGQFTGAVTASIDAAYFVRDYQESKLGHHGLLGLLGKDGVFRAARVGDSFFVGEAVDFEAVLQASDEGGASEIASPWDNVPRFMSVEELQYFPVAVVVGLSRDEQMAAAQADVWGHLARALILSLLLVLFMRVINRANKQRVLSRQYEKEEAMEHAARVEYLAYHDGLTALPNRSLFSKLLSQGIAQAKRHNRQMAILFLDLDHFKQINDTLGHEAGDQLLQEVAQRLRVILRESDTVARLGGDEFVVLLPELDEVKFAGVVAEKILNAISKPIILLEHEFRITTSIGISIYPKDGLDEETLKKHADIAMYQAKGEGKNNYHYYSEQLNVHSLERLTLESSLRLALERNEFELHYQAKRDTQTGLITGMEALLRWRHPYLGTVEPMKFIPMAEEAGLMIPIGKWVIRTACEQNMAWMNQGLPRLNVAVNLTPRQFSDENLVEDVRLILESTGMDGELLELEITEAMLMRDVERTLEVLTQLKQLKVKIAVDDFGTGYSTLATLQQFPLDAIKIDRTFVRNIAEFGYDNSLTEAIISMGRALSLTVIAKGVETREQAEFLRAHSCDEFQGFYLNKPVPAEQVLDLLKHQFALVASMKSSKKQP